MFATPRLLVHVQQRHRCGSGSATAETPPGSATWRRSRWFGPYYLPVDVKKAQRSFVRARTTRPRLSCWAHGRSRTRAEVHDIPPRPSPTKRRTARSRDDAVGAPEFLTTRRHIYIATFRSRILGNAIGGGGHGIQDGVPRPNHDEGEPPGGDGVTHGPGALIIVWRTVTKSAEELHCNIGLRGGRLSLPPYSRLVASVAVRAAPPLTTSRWAQTHSVGSLWLVSELRCSRSAELLFTFSVHLFHKSGKKHKLHHNLWI